MIRTSLDDAHWTSLMLVMLQIQRAREIPQGLMCGRVTRLRSAVSSRPHFGYVGRVRRGVICRTRLGVGQASTIAGGAGACAAGGS